jgi:hypothetical protein
VESGEIAKPTPTTSKKEERPLTAQSPAKGSAAASQTTGPLQEPEKG